MKINLSAVLFVIAAAFSGVFAQTEKSIGEIRAAVAVINKGAVGDTKKNRNVEDISLEGTDAVYYYSAQKLVKVTAKVYGETYNSTVEVYYRDAQPIFVFSKINYYRAPLGVGKSPRVVRSEDRRVYFDGERTLRVNAGRSNVAPSDVRYAEYAASARELANKFAAADTE